MEMKDFIKALATAVLTAIVALIFKYIDPPTILTEVWQRVFVGPWFLWLGAAGFGVYWLVRLLVKLHHDTTSAIPALIRANKELTEKEVLAKTQSLEIFHTASELSLEQEKQNRVAGDSGLSSRLNSLETNLKQDLRHELDALQTELSRLIGEEAIVRKKTSAEISKLFQLDSERMNKIETKFETQIAALNKRMDKAEPPPPLTLKNYGGIINSPAAHVPTPTEVVDSRGKGLLNSASPVPTPREAVVEALIEQKKKQT